MSAVLHAQRAAELEERRREEAEDLRQLRYALRTGDNQSRNFEAVPHVWIAHRLGRLGGSRLHTRTHAAVPAWEKGPGAAVIANFRYGHRSSNHGDPRTVATGFDRHIPYSQVAAVASGRWYFAHVLGGLRVALPNPPAYPGQHAQMARRIHQDPVEYGYVLQNDTYVPRVLSESDRILLAYSA